MTANRAARFLAAVAALLMVTVGTSLATAQTFEDAVTAYDRGDYATALRGFRFHAEQGGPNAVAAQVALGVMYGSGQGVPQNGAEAAKWLRRAAGQGDAELQYLVGGMYAGGEGVPRDAAEAVRWYRRAAEQGHTKAQFNLATMFDNG